MIENRRGFDLFCHAVLILGVVLVVFPVYVAFCAATMSEHEVFSVPLSLVPSTHLFENIATVWSQGSGNAELMLLGFYRRDRTTSGPQPERIQLSSARSPCGEARAFPRSAR